MIRSDRVKIMAELSMMESGRDREKLNIARYRRADYITQQILLSLISGTACFAAMAALWCGAHWETINSIIDLGHPRGLMLRVVFIYVIFLAAYMFLSLFIAYKKYDKAHEYGSRYLARLEDLEQLAEEKEESPSSAQTAAEPGEIGGNEWPGY